MKWQIDNQSYFLNFVCVGWKDNKPTANALGAAVSEIYNPFYGHF